MEDALLLDPPEAVDLGGEPVGHALQTSGFASDLVDPDSPVGIPRLQCRKRLVADRPELDPGALHPRGDERDDLLAALLAQRRDIEPDRTAVDRRRQTDPALADRGSDRPKAARIPGADQDLSRLGDRDVGHLDESCPPALVVDQDGVQQGRGSGADADGKPARAWPIQFLIRRTAHHVMDHAWEMEDRDPRRGVVLT
jgi:hypothetical protein